MCFIPIGETPRVPVMIRTIPSIKSGIDSKDTSNGIATYVVDIIDVRVAGAEIADRKSRMAPIRLKTKPNKAYDFMILRDANLVEYYKGDS